MRRAEAGRGAFACAWCGLTADGPKLAEGGPRCPHCGAGVEPYALADPPPAPTPAASRQAAAPRPAREARGFWAGLVHESARRGSVLEGEIVALVLLSLADLMATYHLLRTHPKFYESNPIAEFFFARWNIAGMAVFKFSIVAFVVVVGEVVERRRPGLGRFVILTGCFASAVVVAHGLRLAFGEMFTG